MAAHLGFFSTFYRRLQHLQCNTRWHFVPKKHIFFSRHFVAAVMYDSDPQRVEKAGLTSCVFFFEGPPSTIRLFI